MTKLEPKKIAIELRLLDLRGEDGTEVSVGQKHIELRLREQSMRGLRLLMHGMRACGGDKARRAAHKMHAIEYLLATVAETYDALNGKESEKSISGKRKQV